MAKVTLNQIAPDFELVDFRGKAVSLSGYRDQRHVVLVFTRGFT